MHAFLMRSTGLLETNQWSYKLEQAMESSSRVFREKGREQPKQPNSKYLVYNTSNICQPASCTYMTNRRSRGDGGVE